MTEHGFVRRARRFTDTGIPGVILLGRDSVLVLGRCIFLHFLRLACVPVRVGVDVS